MADYLVYPNRDAILKASPWGCYSDKEIIKMGKLGEIQGHHILLSAGLFNRVELLASQLEGFPRHADISPAVEAKAVAGHVETSSGGEVKAVAAQVAKSHEVARLLEQILEEQRKQSSYLWGIRWGIAVMWVLLMWGGIKIFIH